MRSVFSYGPLNMNKNFTIKVDLKKKMNLKHHRKNNDYTFLFAEQLILILNFNIN